MIVSKDNKKLFDMDLDNTTDVRMMDSKFYRSMLKGKSQKIRHEIYGKRKYDLAEKIEYSGD